MSWMRFVVMSIGLVACATTPPRPAANRGGGGTPGAPDPIACPESRLRALAAQLPETTLTIKIDDSDDWRGVAHARCELGETDGACLARAYRQIPRGMIAIPDEDGRSGFVAGGEYWELTLEVDGKREVKDWPGPEDPAELSEEYKATGHNAKLISQRRIATPEHREGGVSYGYRRRHRVGTLSWPKDVEAPAEKVWVLVNRLELQEQGLSTEDARQWVLYFTCK
jgi:hypothetical protein